ncbi:Retrovirus-related Pol poly from transposon [Paramuricea clavata]|uniref:Retrovirus-related Pol poly from transposon n=1 Tax=Paramuricea clavata TaxID=317549 RepID=A0A7D9ICS0_PARCT|nr:Retrovirus-related Pol poly from transposon [Paramuricea clavata]
MADDEQAAQPVTISTPSVSIQPLPEFNLDSEVGASLATRWTNCLDDFEMFILASGITEEKRKRALLLYQAGQRVREIFRQLSNTGTTADYKTATDKLTRRFRDRATNCYGWLIIYRIRKKALRDPTYDLKAILIDGRRDEQSAYQARDIESKEQKNEAIRKLQETTTKCRNCGGLYPHTNHCPAKNKQCIKCGKQKHFAKVCRSKPEQKEHSPASQGKRKFETTVETRKRIAVATFYVAKTTDSGNLISLTTAQELGLTSLYLNKVSMTKDKKLGKILDKHAKVFSDLGKLKGEKVELNIDKEHAPKAQPQRRIPYHIREDVKCALSELEQQDIIERVPDNQPTPWISAIVVVPKKNVGVRICVDIREANAAIKRVRHPIPTVEDVSFELNGAKYFSKLDLSQAAYFDTQKATYVTSPVGVSDILSQKSTEQNDEKVVAYASRALADVEKRYTRTEKEALAIIWGVEHFYLYIYGNDFTLITDHKPLEVIYGGRKSKHSARLERWVLHLRPYSFNVVCKPGANNPADYLSRHPPQTSLKQHKLTEEYVNFLTQNSIPKAMTLEEIQAATDSDRTLTGLRAATKLNK